MSERMAAAGISATGPPRPPQRVIVLDDQPGVSMVLARGLARCGYDVFLALSGHEALELIRRRPDIVALVADITIPAMAGIGLAADVQRSHPGLPMLLVTSGPPPAGLLDSPFVEVLNKPVFVDDLLERLEKLISRSAVPTEFLLTPAE